MYLMMMMIKIDHRRMKRHGDDGEEILFDFIFLFCLLHQNGRALCACKYALQMAQWIDHCASYMNDTSTIKFDMDATWKVVFFLHPFLCCCVKGKFCKLRWMSRDTDLHIYRSFRFSHEENGNSIWNIYILI